ncbi:MAG: D-erythronate dehydrogenase [Jatrophihabitans sp.]
MAAEARVVITGGGGFLGHRLAQALLAADGLVVRGESRRLTELCLVDRVEPAPELQAEPRVTVVVAELAPTGDPDALAFLDNADVVVHLAAAVSGECERDFDLGMRSNLAATMAILERCRAQPSPPMFVFSSSVAVFGPGEVDDTTLPRPQTSYGAQKLICEQLVAEYTRKGFLTGRVARLMTVSVRPGRPNGAASGFLSGIVREPLAGVPMACPALPDDQVVIASPARTIEGLIRTVSATDDEWGSSAPLNLPSLRVTVGEMVAEVQRRSPETAELITWEVDESVRAIVQSWPHRFDLTRSAGLGLQPNASFADVVDEFIGGLG